MMKKICLFIALLLLASTQAVAKNISYNVFLIPSGEVDQTVKTISQQLKGEQLHSLYSQHYLPHITLYLTEYPKDNLAAIKSKVAQLASQLKPFDITLGSIKQTKGNWLMLNVKNNQPLQHLADLVTVELAPLRATDPKLPSWVLDYPEKLASFKRYGSPNVFTNFDPHITLLPRSDAESLNRFMQKYGNQFKPVTVQVKGIGIAETNANGQAKHELAEYFFAK
ncbi:2'-5' RNA ligase family protein [Vibrio sp. S4M6]|uniref:2'-5' RNA ligase family protein n=1 Tax=Vibrio sinus TaxID=2946865 RepID=UPI002029D4D7|nr:2'-5' RNA ligase family protein [Vibrio sinus]MCL9783593.1 2'-5' RNA ligase family protein [Vibrio sinus]